MSTIPKTRKQLVELISDNFARLERELDDVDATLARTVCVDDWTVKDLLAVRAWWTDRVVRWVQTGRRGSTPVTPKRGYRWQETPRLNRDIISETRDQSFEKIHRRLTRGVGRVLTLIDELDDSELLRVGSFEWAGKYPIARWISLNTARQYATARTYIRKAKLATR